MQRKQLGHDLFSLSWVLSICFLKYRSWLIVISFTLFRAEESRASFKWGNVRIALRGRTSKCSARDCEVTWMWNPRKCNRVRFDNCWCWCYFMICQKWSMDVLQWGSSTAYRITSLTLSRRTVLVRQRAVSSNTHFCVAGRSLAKVAQTSRTCAVRIVNFIRRDVCVNRFVRDSEIYGITKTKTTVDNPFTNLGTK